jgi:hypothetical protein
MRLRVKMSHMTILGCDLEVWKACAFRMATGTIVEIKYRLMPAESAATANGDSRKVPAAQLNEAQTRATTFGAGGGTANGEIRHQALR